MSQGVHFRFSNKFATLASLAVLSLLLFAPGIVSTHTAHAFSTGQNAAIVLGQPDLNSQSSGTTQSTLSNPQAIAFDSSGNMWVSDESNNRVLEFKAPLSTGEAASVVLGEADFTTSFNDCYGSSAINPSCLNLPIGLTFDSSGNLWVVDSMSYRILEFQPPFTNGENASLVIGQPDLFTGPGSDTPASASVLNAPQGISFDSSGNLWVADAGYNRVLEFKAPFSNGEAASLVLGQDNFTSGTFANYAPGCQLGQECPTASSLTTPQGVSFDHSGNLWTTERTTGRILEFKAPFTNGESASLVLGQPKFTTFGDAGGFYCSVVTPAQYCVSADSLTFASSGTMWVADTDNWRVLSFNPPFSNYQNASLVLGQPDFEALPPAAGQQNATASNLNSPESVAIDSSGNLWVSDSAQNRIVEFLASVQGSTSTTQTSNIASSSSTTTTFVNPSSTITSMPTTSTTTAFSQSTANQESTSSSGGALAFPFADVAIEAVIVAALAITWFGVVRRARN